MKVVIIGTGNVATVLGVKMFEAGHEIIQVVARNSEKATELASHINAANSSNLDNINALADIYLIAVADSAIPDVAAHLSVDNAIVVHTAASVSKEVLNKTSENYGVIYPLQSLKKEVKTVPPIPILIDGSNENTIDILREFSLQLFENVIIANDEERLKLHVAAVFVNNFTNHLFAVAEKYCRKEQLNFNLLLPLIKETIDRVACNPPSQLQTGPAIRKDFITIEKHEQLLKAYPDYLKLYKILSNSIVTDILQNND